MIPRIYLKLLREHAKIQHNIRLVMSVKVVNDSAEPKGLISGLLGLDVMPQLFMAAPRLNESKQERILDSP